MHSEVKWIAKKRFKKKLWVYEVMHACVWIMAEKINKISRNTHA